MFEGTLAATALIELIDDAFEATHTWMSRYLQTIQSTPSLIQYAQGEHSLFLRRTPVKATIGAICLQNVDLSMALKTLKAERDACPKCLLVLPDSRLLCHCTDAHGIVWHLTGRQDQDGVALCNLFKIGMTVAFPQARGEYTAIEAHSPYLFETSGTLVGDPYALLGKPHEYFSNGIDDFNHWYFLRKDTTAVAITQWTCGDVIELYLDPPQERGEVLRIIAELRLPLDGWWFPENRPKRHGHDPTVFSVWRLDDNGGEYLVQDGITAYEAGRLVTVFETRGHKQSYEIRPTPI